MAIVDMLEKVSSSTHLQAFGSIDGPQGSKYSKDPENLHHRDGRRPECNQRNMSVFRGQEPLQELTVGDKVTAALCLYVKI